MKYTELKNKQEKEMNKFPMFFAFSTEQLKEGMEKLGLTLKDKNKLYGTGCGGYYLKTDSQKLSNLIDRHHEEMKNEIKKDTTGDGFIFSMFDYELSNHEYCITFDFEPAIDAIGLSIEEINKSKSLLHGLNLAVKNNQEGGW